MLSRRRFLRLAAASGTWPLLASCQSDETRVFDIPGRIVNGPAIPGHRLRSEYDREDFPPPESTLFDVVIVGGGISGLSAAWKLRRAGVERVLLLELSQELGGTSVAAGANGMSFPWGAHYINIPPAEADCIKEVLQDLGIITGYDAAGRPQIAEGHRLRSPKERLYREDEWLAELDPFAHAGAGQVQVLRSFEDDMLRWTLQEGADGRRAFAMPLLYSSKEARYLDTITMRAYMRGRQWDCRELDWLVNFACRDDYGGTIDTVSAWAGIHYFACRFYDPRLQDRYPSDTLTWAEGNGFLVKALASPLLPQQVRTGSVVVRILEEKGAVHVMYLEANSGSCRHVKGRAVVYAGKLHTAPHVLPGLPDPQRQAIASCTYSPWLVAAIHVTHLPQDPVVPPAWDNVLYDSPSLGYIVADHQQRHSGQTDRSVLVYYLPFVKDPATARRELLAREHRYWMNKIMRDLTRAHPDLEQWVERIDIYRWGHAMLRPEPGIIWGDESYWRRRPVGAVFFATCDATGLPLFEEACFAGIWAAEQSMRHLGVAFTTSLQGLSS